MAVTITRGQVSTLGVTGSATSITTTWGTNPAAGSKILVAVQFDDVSSVLTVTDNGTTPRTFTLDATSNGNAGVTPVYIYRADNITLPVAGSYTVTVSTSGIAHGIQAGGVEYKGAKAGAPTGSNTPNGSGSPVSTGNATPAAAGALFFAAFFDDSTSASETITLTGSGFTEQFTQVNGSSYWAGGVADKIAAGGPSATACTWTLGDTPAWNAAIVTYDAATSAAAPSRRQAVSARIPAAQQRLAGPGLRGRVASNRGGPVHNPVPFQGPAFRPLRWPARIRPSLPPRGRAAGNKGTPVRNPTSGPVFIQAVKPIRAPVPKTFSKGRGQSTPPYVQPPRTANQMAIGLTLTAGGLNEWQYIGQFPVTYLQYMQPPGEVLQPVPGEIFTQMGPASGYPYYLATPPPDGRWIIVGSGGQVYYALTAPREDGPGPVDDLEWNPPPHLAHLPVPFSLIAARIRRKQQQRRSGRELTCCRNWSSASKTQPWGAPAWHRVKLHVGEGGDGAGRRLDRHAEPGQGLSPVTWAAVGTPINVGTASFSLTPGGVGNLILLEIQSPPATAAVTGVSSSNATWVQVGNSFAGTTNNRAAVVWAGTVTSTSTQTVNVTFSGSPTAIRINGQEFSSTVGSWAQDGSQGNLDSAGTNTWPSLTPSVNGALYFGWCYDAGTATAGSTSGFTYQPDPQGNGLGYALNCSAGVAMTPVWGDSTMLIGVMLLMKETGTVTPAPFFPMTQPVRAPIQAVRQNAGERINFSPGAPVRNPRQGPVFRQSPRPAQARIPREQQRDTGPAWRGRIYGISPGAPVRNPTQGPVFRQAVRPAQARIPREQQREMLPGPRGRAYGIISKGAPVRNPVQGPVFKQAVQPCQARIPQTAQPANERISFNPGGPVANPSQGPLFRQAVQAVRARLPLQPLLRGRCSSSPGAPPANPSAGPVFQQRITPVRFALPQLRPRAGRIGSAPGGPVINPIRGPAVYPLPGPVRARQPLPSRGRTASTPPYAAPFIPHPSGPVFTPAVQAVRARLPLQPLLRGRSASSASTPVRNPSAGPVFTAAVRPIRTAVPQTFSKGRIASSPGGPVRNPSQGPAFTQAVRPSRAPVPQVFSKGRVAANPGSPVVNPSRGPVFRQATSPARSRLPQLQPGTGLLYAQVAAPPPSPPVIPRAGAFSSGRISASSGAQVNNPVPGVTGPPFFPFRQAVHIRFALPPRGRTAGSKGAPVVNPSAGPRFVPLNHPASARQPLPPRGRTAGSKGAPVVHLGPVFAPATSPARARLPVPFLKGRVASNPGSPAANPQSGPMFRQAVQALRARLPVPFLKGRAAGNPGCPVRNPGQGPAFTPVPRPVRVPVPEAFSKGRVASSPGGPVHNPPVPAPVYPLHGPVQARRPLPGRGRVASNPGISVPVPSAGPRFVPRHDPARIRPALPPRGRVGGSPGAAVRNPHAGPQFVQAVKPIRAVIPQNAPRGRTSSNPGGPVQNKPFTRILVYAGQPFTLWEPQELFTLWEPGSLITGWDTGDPFPM